MIPLHTNRRNFLRLLGGAALCAAGPAAWGCGPSLPVRKGVAFLAKAQSPDGAWRSDHYGFFRGGDALTPLVLYALLRNPLLTRDSEPVSRGRHWLDALTDRLAGLREPWLELRYPLFSASYAARYYASHGDRTRAAVWADCIEALQLTASLGWQKEDPRHGAWGDSSLPPQRAPGSDVPDMLNPNLSATVFAVLGLAAVDRHERARQALPFIHQCQNLSTGTPESFDDGGFHFSMNDPVRNKAGVAGRDASGRERYRSYGSTTCDGVLALLALGHKPEEPRIAAALHWLGSRTATFTHPGDWPDARKDSGRALLYYHAQALQAVLRQCPSSWNAQARRAIATGLGAAQSSEGSWANPDPESCEDDALVATSLAMLALGV